MSTAFFALIRKDLHLFFTDRRSMIMSFFAPIAIASFFGFVLGGQSRKETSRIAIRWIDLDASEISREIGRRLTEDKGLAVKPSILEEAREDVRKGRAAVAVVVPKNFGQDAGRAFFNSAGKPELQVLYDPSRGPEAAMVRGMLTGHVMQAVSREMFSGASGQQVVGDTLKRLDQIPIPQGERAALRDLLHGVERWNATSRSGASTGTAGPSGLSVPYELREEAITAQKGGQFNPFANSFAGMGVQFILFMGIEAGVSILLQRQRGLWKRLRAAPLSRAVLLGSRAVSAAITAMLILIVLFSFARVAFGVRIEGSMAGFLGVGLAFALMTSAYGLLIAAVGGTPEATRPLAVFATLILVMLGGSWIPSFLFPQWLQTVTLVIPTRWAVDGLNAMTWRGLGFDAALAPIGMLLGFTVLFGLLAVWRFRWEAE